MTANRQLSIQAGVGGMEREMRMSVADEPSQQFRLVDLKLIIVGPLPLEQDVQELLRNLDFR